VPSADLYAAYVAWRLDTEEQTCLSEVVFGKALKTRGYQDTRVGPAHARVRARKGLRLKSPLTLPSTDTARARAA
jgi:hypothetical protein